MENTLYQSIAPYYNQIFQLSENEKKFYNNFNISPRDNVLEIGCGTGQLTHYLSNFTKNITGIDLDSTMIDFAKSSFNDINFIKLDMKNIATQFSGNKFNYIFCMGNTLVHLKNLIEIESFFKNVKKILNSDGKFIFQILNYNKILNNNIKNLPLIENDRVTFERSYKLENNSSLTFKTTLTIKKVANKKIENETTLFPLKYDEIIKILNKFDFKNMHSYGNFAFQEFDVNNSDLLIGISKN